MTEIKWPEGTIVVTLGAETCGCMDYYHKTEGEDHVAHICNTSPGDEQVCNDEDGDGPCALKWRVGDTIRLIPLPEGMYPAGDPVEADLDDEASLAGVAVTTWLTKKGDFSAVWDWSRQFSRYGQQPGVGAFQWKGTSLCCKFRCGCGVGLELDGVWFAYTIRCPVCGVVYYTCSDIELTEMSR